MRLFTAKRIACVLIMQATFAWGQENNAHKVPRSDLAEIHVAARLGDIRKAESAFSADPSSLENRDENGWTPLAVASRYGKVEMAQFLIARGAKIETASKAGWTPLHIAAYFCQPDVAQVLIEKGAEADARTTGISVSTSGINQGWQPPGMTPLLLAAGQYRSEWHYANEVVELLIKKGANVNAKTPDGNSALHYVAMGGHPKTVKLLVSQNCSIDSTNQAGQTPLRIAALGNHWEVAEALLANGAQVDAADKDGRTALHIVAEKGNYYLAEILAAKGANVNAKDRNGITPLSLAIKTNEAKTQAVLRKFGAKE